MPREIFHLDIISSVKAKEWIEVKIKILLILIFIQFNVLATGFEKSEDLLYFQTPPPTMPPEEPPATPTNLAGTADSTSAITWSWDSVEGATSYTLLDEEIIYSGSDTSYQLTELEYGEYSVRILASNEYGDSATSDWISAYTLSEIPTSPSAVADSNSSITVSWSSGGGEDGFVIYYSGDSYASPIYSDETSYQKTGLSVNSPYTFHIHSFNGDSLKSDYVAVSKYTLANTPSVNMVALSSTSLKATLNANGNPEITTYAFRVGALYVQTDGTLGESAVYQTSAQWGASVIIKGLIMNFDYETTPIARNGDNIDALGAPVGMATLAEPIGPIGGAGNPVRGVPETITIPITPAPVTLVPLTPLRKILKEKIEPIIVPIIKAIPEKIIPIVPIKAIQKGDWKNFGDFISITPLFILVAIILVLLIFEFKR